MARCFAIGSGPRYMIRVKLFLHVARFRKHTDMRELHSKRVQLRAKRVRQNLMPRATAYLYAAARWACVAVPDEIARCVPALLC